MHKLDFIAIWTSPWDGCLVYIIKINKADNAKTNKRRSLGGKQY